MLASCYMGNRTLALLDREGCPPGPGFVELKVAYTGICGTDLHILHGMMDKRVKVPAVIGHEMSGTVLAVGEGVDGWAVGDHAVVMHLDWCGGCHACRTGNSHVCYNLNFLGIDLPGSMQGRWTVPAGALVRIPLQLPLETAALVEPTAVAVHDVRRSGLRSGEKVLVVGAGPIGLLVASVAGAAGADVTVVELNPERRSIAEGLGVRALDPAGCDIPGVRE